ncbi:hypothetical protein D3C84_1025500 [compost metagenome]
MGAAMDRLFQGAGDALIVDPQISEFVLLQQVQEFTVGNGLDFSLFRPPTLQQHQGAEGDDEVPDIPLMLLFHDDCPPKSRTLMVQVWTGLREHI